MMTTEYMLRDYKVKSGEMTEWLREWSTKIYPLRLKFGFKVTGAWIIGKERFVWILSYDGEKGGFKKADERYYDSKLRKSLKPNPARHLSKVRHWMMESALAEYGGKSC